MLEPTETGRNPIFLVADRRPFPAYDFSCLNAGRSVAIGSALAEHCRPKNGQTLSALDTLLQRRMVSEHDDLNSSPPLSSPQTCPPLGQAVKETITNFHITVNADP